MFCQIKLPTRGITFSCDLSKIDVIELGKNPDLDEDDTMFILFYKADNDAPAFKINCTKLNVQELMDLFDWLCEMKRDDSDIPPIYNIDNLKSK